MLDSSQSRNLCQLSFYAACNARLEQDPPLPFWQTAQTTYCKFAPLIEAGSPGFPVEWQDALTADPQSGKQWTAQLAGVCAAIISQSILYARSRKIGGKPMTFYQLVQQKISTLTTLEQLLILNLDALEAPEISPKQHGLASDEVVRVAHDLSDLVVDHLGGTGYASYRMVPVCAVLQKMLMSRAPMPEQSYA